jgi:hypothetical protein
MCAASVKDQSACTNDPSCVQTCGLNISALTTSKPMRTCTCSASKWSCPGTAGSCVYPTDIDATCFQLPSPVPACPKDPADGGTMLIKNGASPCEDPSSEVCGNLCGSAAAGTPSYQDAMGASQVGYCVCISGTWQCASVNDWPKP